MRPPLQPNPDAHALAEGWELSQLPEAIEADFFEALSGGAISPALAAYAAAHPEVAAELDDARALASMLRDDAEHAHPGAEFFEALHDDVLGQLGPQRADAEAVDAIPAPAQPVRLGWLERVRSLLSSARPALAALALAGVAAVCVWALFGDAGAPPAPSDADAPRPALAGYDPAAHLSDAEREALRDLARDVDITLELDTQPADYDGDSLAIYDDALAGGSFEPDDLSGGALSDEAFDAAFAELKGSL